MTKAARRIAIVAGGAGRETIPFGDPGWDIWGCNALWEDQTEAQYHRWYELHRRSYLTWEHGGLSENAHFRWLRGLRTLPVYVQQRADWPEVMTAHAFPFKLVQAIAPMFRNYHACSIDWMLAHAIIEGATHIRLFGVEQQHTAEPLSSRACVEFWSGFAVARGIKVSSADGSTFRLAHLTYTDTPYALDPTWLPSEDRTGDSRLSRSAATLRAQVTGNGHGTPIKERVS